ncbi:cytochrome c peroxidase [Hephaestia caeni]|uniref:Cytochrome c peroxidase n=1 Tax=Hephaestia caeni TaxID=645617 RepID=A0A397PCM2_9SPHN|nr:cytochrome c peroxidase [Hephaestia caeni]RIA46718.1 cytochrome c peroxidase [Hephaestia caeni]
MGDWTTRARWWAPAITAIALAGAVLHAAVPGSSMSGVNPHPIKLVRPPQRPLSALAMVGKRIFHDASLSASGRQSCASCHDPARSFGPPDDRDTQIGGPHMDQVGIRPPPSLAYLYRQTVFSIGPPIADYDNPPPLSQLVEQAKNVPRATKAAGVAPPPAAPVPQGGLFWDGRADSLMLQAMGPMTNPAEMANRDVAAVARKLERAGYVARLEPLFGRTVVNNPAMLVEEAMSAVARYQIEDVAFHRFDSKYDYWLEGKARLTRAEMRGMQLFNDPAKGDCAACHISQPSPDGLPPLFTDTEYEALGVPRNRRLAANRDPHFFDLGLCGPLRKDLAQQTQYCGMFLTPTLRNAAKREVYFHNGVYHRLIDVLRFYALRGTDPGKIYPRDARGRVMKYDDLPRRYWANIDTADAPFDRKFGEKPALTEAEMNDIIAFLNTLDDGYGAGEITTISSLARL